MIPLLLAVCTPVVLVPALLIGARSVSRAVGFVVIVAYYLVVQVLVNTINVPAALHNARSAARAKLIGSPESATCADPNMPEAKNQAKEGVMGLAV